jgi:cytochrome c oxidase assembly factor 3, fungi type
MSPGLQRAREPFRFRNAITGLVLASFAVGVWAYSIGAVKQDVWDDVDEEAKELARTGAGAQVKSLEDEAKERAAEVQGAPVTNAQRVPTAQVVVNPIVIPPVQGGLPPVTQERPKGVIAGLLAEKYPHLLDPVTKTLVWGAPPVDNVGKFKFGAGLSRKP